MTLYASWYAAEYGRFTLVGGDGVALWARTMTFADCRVIRPPADEARLCPNGTYHDASGDYVWDPWSPLNRAPGGVHANDGRARGFALRAIAAQPRSYLTTVVNDVSLAFHWEPARHPRRVRPAFGFTKDGSTPPDLPGNRTVIARYDPAVAAYHPVEPYAGLLRAYQHPAYLRGPLLAAILLLGGLAAVSRRNSAWLPWLFAVILLVGPVAALDFDHRYVLPVVPVACIAAAGAVRVRRTSAG